MASPWLVRPHDVFGMKVGVMTVNLDNLGWRGRLRIFVCRIWRNPFVENDIRELKETVLGLQSAISRLVIDVQTLLKTEESTTSASQVLLLRKQLSALQTRVDAIGNNVATARVEMAGVDLRSYTSAPRSSSFDTKGLVTHDVFQASIDSLIALMNDFQMKAYQQGTAEMARIDALEQWQRDQKGLVTQEAFQAAMDNLIALMNDFQMTTYQQGIAESDRIAALEQSLLQFDTRMS
jgi:hypothetical protein